MGIELEGQNGISAPAATVELQEIERRQDARSPEDHEVAIWPLTPVRRL